MLGTSCPYTTAVDVEGTLKSLAMEEPHLKALARAMLDARITKLANQARDAVFQNGEMPDIVESRPTFDNILNEARNTMHEAISDGSWAEKCKGREILRAFCGQHNVKYEHFRNSVIAQLKAPPAGLAEIMNKILAQQA